MDIPVKLALLGGVLVSIALTFVVGSFAEATPGHDPVTICHATASRSNPYVRITVDSDAVDGLGRSDHTHHTGPIFPAAGWGDIIPPHPDNSLNWTDEGQAIYDNDCQVAATATPTGTREATETATRTRTPTRTSTPTETSTPTPTATPVLQTSSITLPTPVVPLVPGGLGPVTVPPRPAQPITPPTNGSGGLR